MIITMSNHNHRRQEGKPEAYANGNSCESCLESSDHTHEHDEIKWMMTLISGVLIVFGIIMEYIEWGDVIPRALLLSAILIEGHKPARKGFKDLGKGKVGIDLLMTIAATGAVIIGEYAEGALVLFLKDISMKLEVMTSNRARKAIEALMTLRPETALIKRNGGEIEVPVGQVVPGEIFMVKPGDRIPLDGLIVKGETTVDQSMMTGESLPIYRGYFDEVYAGTINLEGMVTVKTKRASAESMLSNILRMVHEAEERKSPTESIVNKFAQYYTPVIIMIASLFVIVPPFLLNGSLSQSLYSGLVLLVIGCPCAFTIATPVAMISAITSASRNGVLIKGSTFIERVNKASIYAFDKTGTLTQGRLNVTDVVTYGVTRNELLSVAASLEENSKHPIASAISDLALHEGVDLKEISEFKSKTGKGIEASIEGAGYCIGNSRLFKEKEIECPENALRELEIQGKTTVLVARDDETIGLISLMDEKRKGAEKTIKVLRTRKMKVEMLTGDNETTATAIAENMGFNGVHANLLPEEKVKTIEDMKNNGKVVMIGDGVNDAPALAVADVGIAMGGLGSDIALETADIVLLEDDLTKINYLVRLSEITLNRIRENIGVSIGMKLIIVVLAAMNTINLWQSVILGDVGLTLLVLLNSIRISGVKP